MKKDKDIKKETKKLETFEKPRIEIVVIDQSLVISTTTCLAKGTKITMSDGSLKNIEDINENDFVLTFNHEKGCFENSEVLYLYRCDEPKSPFIISFEDGTELSIIGEHDLFEKESLKYVTLTDADAEEFIGKHFYSVNKKAYIRLVSVTRCNEKVDYYEVYTKNSFNCIANGMLNVADDVDYMLNIYEFNDDLTINTEKFNQDIKQFGLFQYSDEYGVTKNFFEDWNMRYVSVAIGKGLITMEELFKQHSEYNTQVFVRTIGDITENNIEVSKL